MAILALDLGTHTGVALGRAGAQPVSETWELPARGGAEVGAFMSAFASRLDEALIRGVSLLVFEAPYVGAKMLSNMHVARRLIGLPAICEMLAHRRGVPVFEANILTVKSYFAGHGHAQKADMIRAAKQRGFAPANEHEADALGVWLLTVARTSPEHAAMYDPIFARGHV